MKNSTLATVPSASDAVAAKPTVAGAVKFAPFAGCVNVTVGAVFAALTVIVAGALVVVAPRLSVARAVTVYVPTATPPQLKL